MRRGGHGERGRRLDEGAALGAERDSLQALAALVNLCSGEANEHRKMRSRRAR